MPQHVQHPHRRGGRHYGLLSPVLIPATIVPVVRGGWPFVRWIARGGSRDGERGRCRGRAAPEFGTDFNIDEYWRGANGGLQRRILTIFVEIKIEVLVVEPRPFFIWIALRSNLGGFLSV